MATASGMGTPAVKVLARAESATALLHPLRLRILQALGKPDSAAGVARRLGLARQKVNYHLRELEKEGLVTLAEERRKGNCTERVVQASARSYLISPAVLGDLATEPEKIRDRFSWAYLVAVAGRAIRELATLRSRADRADKKLATLTVDTGIRFASAAELKGFAGELATEIARLTAKYHNEKTEKGRLFRFFVGVYPAITKQADDETATGQEEQDERDEV